MSGRIRGASGFSSEIQLGAGGSKVKSSADGTVEILESDGATEGTLTSGELKATNFHSNGGHLKFRTSTNDAIFYLSDAEQYQIYRHSSGDTHFTSSGGSKGFGFNGMVDLVSGFKVGGTEITASAAELNYVDGVTSSIQTQFNSMIGSIFTNASGISTVQTAVNNAKVRHVSITHDNATGSAIDFGTALASGAFVSRVVVKITEAFTAGSTLKIGDLFDDDGFGTVDDADLQAVGTQIIFHAPYANKPLSSSVQAQYTLTGSPTTGECTISIQQELI